MSLRNTTHLMTSMINRASGITFDPVIPTGRAQFNPNTGSWVFGLAAFAAGVAINKMINPESTGSRSSVKPHTPPTSTSPLRYEQLDKGHMRSLLRDTMAEEARSGDHIDIISSEVARLRDEIAALSAQKEQVRESGSEGEKTNSGQVLEEEFEKVRATLQQLKMEKEELTRTEQELLGILRSQSSNSPYTEIAQNQLDGIQSQLARVKNEQLRIESEYESSKANNSHAVAAIDSLQKQLQEKVAKLQEAEQKERSLRNDHRVLMETVESLKTQLEFFRSKTTQDQSGVTSLKILEESNNKLSEQVSSSLQKTEQQQAALHRLAAEKSLLAQELAQYKEQAQLTKSKMSELEAALTEAKRTEHHLLQKVEELSQHSHTTGFGSSERLKLEQELESARVSIQVLEGREQALQAKLTEVESSLDQGNNNLIINQLTAERDALQKALDSSDQNFRDLESNYNEQMLNAQQQSGSAKTELVIAAEKEEELNHQITSLLLKVKSLEDERDLFRSRAEVINLHTTDASNEFMALKQTILTLESEKRSLVSELDEQKSKANAAQLKLTDTEARLDALSKDEVLYKDEVSSIQESISGHQQLRDDFALQQKELSKARQEISALIAKNQSKDHELVAAQRELAKVQYQLAQISQRSANLQNEEHSAHSRVSLIQNELIQKDKLISDSKVKEDALKREVEALRQAANNMESEIQRLTGFQSDIGVSSSSLTLLQQTEKQLRAQLEQASSEIGRQHRQLLDAEQTRVQLENKQRDESLKLAAIVAENNALKDQLKNLQLQERDQHNFVSQSRKEVEKFQNLEQELKALDQRKSDLEKKLFESQSQDQQLRSQLGIAEQKLQEVAYERDLLSKELESVKKELAQVVSERNELQVTCRNLETSLKDLERKKVSGGRKRSSSDKVIPLTSDDEIRSNERAKYEGLDTTVFEESDLDLDGEFESIASNELFQSTKPGKSLRKFKGHRKIEAVEVKDKELDSKIKELDSILKDNIEHAEEIDLDEGDEIMRKAYSPNRSFSELLEDSERRKSESKSVDLEIGWDELDSIDLEDEFVKEEKNSLKPLFYGGAAAGILVGTLSFLYMNARNAAPDKPAKPDVAASSSSGANLAGDAANLDVANQAIMDKQALEILNTFHQAKEFEQKSSVCRVPNRTFKDMKIYYKTNTQDFLVEKVMLREKPLKKSGLTLWVADIEGILDGTPINKVAYFQKNSEGKLLLDWHSYVDFERVPWKKFLNFNDNERSEDWHVIIKRDSNEHTDYPLDKFTSFKVRSWNPDAYGSTYAYLSKKDPMHEQLLDALKQGQTRFILRLRHTGDISGELVIDEVVSLSEFYLTDVDDTVSSSFDEISFDDSSY